MAPRGPSCHIAPPPDEEPAARSAEPDWAQLLAALPREVEATSQATGALRRRRQVRSGATLLRLVLLYCWWDWPLRLVAAWACASGWADLSDVALLHRLQRARAYLSALVTACVVSQRTLSPRAPVRLRLVDATTISRPGSAGADWRVHLSFDVGQWAIDGLELTDVHGGETLVRHAAQPGDIQVADRGYGHRRGIGQVFSQGGSLVVRINVTNLPLQDSEGIPLDLGAWLRHPPPGEPVERAVQVVTPAGPFALRLIAGRLSEAAAQAARRRLRRAARKKGRTPTQRSLAAAGWVLLVSNLDAATWSAAQLLALYRLRWQVELVFKRLKGLLQLDHLRARGPELAQVYLLGKLLGALLVERLTNAAPRTALAWFSQVERPVSAWRWAQWWFEAVRQAVRGLLSLARLQEALPRLQRYLCDAPRHRRAQGAPARLAFAPPGLLAHRRSASEVA
jgi:hypothetical protein